MKNSKRLFSLILCLSIVFTMLSGVCTVSAATKVTAQKYLSGIDGISYVRSITREDIITDESTTTNRSIEMYDALNLYIRYSGNWNKMIQPVRDVLKEAAVFESKGTDKYGDTEYYYFIYETAFKYNAYRLYGKTASQKMINEGGLIYIECCTVTILPKDMTGISFEDAEYIYDGTEKSIAVTGNLPIGAKVEYTNEKATNAGTYNATAKVTCEGYNDLALNATLKINPKNLTVSGLTAQNKKYDGTDTANLSGGSLNGKISGDDVNADIPATGKFANANAGNNIAVSIDSITLTGTKKDNYTLTQPTGLKANIEKAEITVRANDKQIVKGAAIPKLDYAIIGELYGNDKITGELKVNTDGNTVGDFDITQGTLTVSSNYKLTFVKGKLSVVNKTPQNITVSEDGKTFDIKPVNVPIGSTIVLALYDNGRFIKMQSEKYNGTDIQFTTDKSYTNAKVMFFESLSNIKPVCDAETVK